MLVNQGLKQQVRGHASCSHKKPMPPKPFNGKLLPKRYKTRMATRKEIYIMESIFEDKKGKKISPKKAIKLLTREYIKADDEKFFTRKQQKEYATHVVDTSKDGTIW
jgi:site-specific recombinase XerC